MIQLPYLQNRRREKWDDETSPGSHESLRSCDCTIIIPSKRTHAYLVTSLSRYQNRLCLFLPLLLFFPYTTTLPNCQPPPGIGITSIFSLFLEKRHHPGITKGSQWVTPLYCVIHDHHFQLALSPVCPASVNGWTPRLRPHCRYGTCDFRGPAFWVCADREATVMVSRVWCVSGASVSRTS